MFVKHLSCRASFSPENMGKNTIAQDAGRVEQRTNTLAKGA